MSVKTRAVNVGLTATRLDTSSDVQTPITFYNNGAGTIFVGGSDVTTSNGVPVPASTWGPAFDLWPLDALYGIVASTTSEARVIETGL